ncbi:MAG: hypothetical protein E6G89_12235 [Alphaproteobacteria bacterium]|nr:MAG: hypothetical protein E6G89_12235 [Alphaproteobacteria bacterium]
MMRMRFGIDPKMKSTMSWTGIGKTAFTAFLLATFTVMTPLAAYAERGEGNSWWTLKKTQDDDGGSSGGNSNSNIMVPSTTSNIAGSKAGKAVTKTEVFADRSVTPMVSTSSPGAMANAISRYEAIAAQGGWGTISTRGLAKGDDGDAVVALKRRLIAEGYLSADSLSGDTGVWYTAVVERAVAQYQANNGLAVTGNVDKTTVNALNVPVARRLATMRANVPRLQEYSKGLANRYIIVNAADAGDHLPGVGHQFQSLLERAGVDCGARSPAAHPQKRNQCLPRHEDAHLRPLERAGSRSEDRRLGLCSGRSLFLPPGSRRGKFHGLGEDQLLEPVRHLSA